MYIFYAVQDKYTILHSRIWLTWILVKFGEYVHTNEIHRL